MTRTEEIFKRAFGQCMYETLNQQLFSKQNKEDWDYLINAYQKDVEMNDASETEDKEQIETEEEGDDGMQAVFDQERLLCSCNDRKRRNYNKGNIRLFGKIGNAKTALPALGDPIIDVVVAADGRWVLATCKTYLLLVDAEIKDGEHRLGLERAFQRPKGGELRFDFPSPWLMIRSSRFFLAFSLQPVPKRLQLRPEHVAYMARLLASRQH
jgi:hypothetical protein